MLKQATKTCNSFWNIGGKQVEKHILQPTLKPVLQQIRLLQVE